MDNNVGNRSYIMYTHVVHSIYSVLPYINYMLRRGTNKEN